MKNDLRYISAVFGGRTIKMLCLVFSIVFVTGCATSEETNRMQWNINALRAEVKEIKQKSTQFPGQQKQSDQKVQELEEMQRAAAKTVSDLLIRIQYLTTEVQMLTGRFEESRYHSEKNSAELKESKEMIFAKMKQLEIMGKDIKKRLAKSEITPTSKEEEQKQGKVSKEELVEHKDDSDNEAKKEDVPVIVEEKDLKKDKPEVKNAYMTAYEAYKAGRTVDAREQFGALLTDYAENEYSDNARFWIASSYYKDGNYEDAILAYE